MPINPFSTVKAGDIDTTLNVLIKEVSKQPMSDVTATTGQTLVWDGDEWAPFSNPELSGEVFVYVSNAGSDTSGDGSVAAPWATIMHALFEMPSQVVFSSGAAGVHRYVIRVVAPYTGPFGHAALSFDSRFSVPAAGAAAGTTLQVVVQAWTPDINVDTVSDPRYTVVYGPLTPASVTTFGGNRPQYTLAPGTITAADQWLGEFVRVYQSGVEVSRGIVVRSSSVTQELLIQHGTAYTPNAADQLYIVRPSVVLGGVPPALSASFSSLAFTATGPTFPLVRFEHLRLIDAFRLGPNTFLLSVGCQWIANGGSGCLTDGDAGSQLLTTVNSISGVSQGAVSLYPGSSFSRSGGGTVFFGGTISISDRNAVLGAYSRSSGSTTNPDSNFVLSGNCTMRGQISLDSTARTRGSVRITGGTDVSPVLMIHRSGALISLAMGAQADLQGSVAVDAASASGNVLTLREGLISTAAATPVKFIPADAAVLTMASGIVAAVTRDGLIRILRTSTLRGAGGVDVKTGNNAAITWAALDALANDRDNDAASMSSILGA